MKISDELSGNNKKSSKGLSYSFTVPKGKIIWSVLSVIIAVLIFISSSISGEVSGYASMRIADMVRYVMPFGTEMLGFMNFLVRKTAHVVVYFALAFCITHSIKYHIHKSHKLLIASWGIAAFYGVTDEIHQYFVPGRVMAISDMVINAVGALAGAALVVWWVNRHKI